MWMQVDLVLSTAFQTLPPPGSMCSPSPVQTPLSAHSALLLHLPRLIVPLYFIAVIAVQEKSVGNRISAFEKWLSLQIRKKFPLLKLTLKLLLWMVGVKCHLKYNHHTEFGGVPSQYETYTLKTSCVVILVFHFQELMDLPLHSIASSSFTRNHISCWITSNI
jgi:hypothetical protein